VVVVDLKHTLSVDHLEVVVVVVVVPEDLLEDQGAAGAMVGHDKSQIIC